jgi:hypothetical protein
MAEERHINIRLEGLLTGPPYLCMTRLRYIWAVAGCRVRSGGGGAE